MSKDPLIGQVLHDTHRIVRLIGQGGMGSVYEAVHKRLRKQRFAVKVLHKKMVENETVFARFKQEAEIATEIGHPNIVYVTDFYETDDGQPCMVMEYLDGEDLGERIKKRGKLSPQEVLEMMEQVGGALQAVHDKGVTHRDLKPANIFMVDRPDGKMKAKVLDFGISKIRDSGTLTGDHAILGTPHYMSPEQGEGEILEVDYRTDIFALGTICYQVLSGKVPFEAPTLLGVIRAICDKPHVPITVHAPSLGSEVDRVLSRALAKKKVDRYQRVDVFAQELTRALEGKGNPHIVLDGGAPQSPDRTTTPHLLMVDERQPAAAPPDGNTANVLDIELASHGGSTISEHDAVSPEASVKAGSSKKRMDEPSYSEESPDPNITNVMGIVEAICGEPEEQVERLRSQAMSYQPDESEIEDEVNALPTELSAQSDLPAPPENKVELHWDQFISVDQDARPEVGTSAAEITTLSGSMGQKSAKVVKPAKLSKGLLIMASAVTAAALLALGGAYLATHGGDDSGEDGSGSPVIIATSRPVKPSIPPHPDTSIGVVTVPLEEGPVTGQPLSAPEGTPARKVVEADARPTTRKKTSISLILTPSSARVFLDGKPCKDNPLILTRSGRKYRIRVSAANYLAQERKIMANKDQSLQFTLISESEILSAKQKSKRNKPHPAETSKSTFKRLSSSWQKDSWHNGKTGVDGKKAKAKAQIKKQPVIESTPESVQKRQVKPKKNKPVFEEF